MKAQSRLFDLLKQGVTPFHSVRASKEDLVNNGFTPLSYEDSWNLEKGGKYVVEHHGTSLFAFTIGEEWQPTDMLRLAAAHTDYPCMRIKPNGDFATNGYAQINIEVYGGPILNTWFDRPLGVAGRVALRSENPFEPKMVLYKSSKAVMTIPNLAIHMNREVNQGVAINNQVDLMPILDMLPEDMKNTKYFMAFLAEELGVEEKDILDFELCLYVMEDPSYIGIKDSFISSPRLDNQTSVSALVWGLVDGKRKDGVNIIALFDHEEVGNTSKQGAASIFLHDLTKRILYTLGATTEEAERAIYKSMLLSVDVAHGLHPNKPGKMDITNKPVLGKGFCIKEASSQSYATDAQAIGILAQICDQNQIPYQRFLNRSDVRGGGTLGSVASTLLPIKTVDLGVPLLAMHSSRELMGAADMDALYEAVKTYFAI